MENKMHLDESILNMYLDGELEAGQQARVEAHLAVCGACRMERDALQGLFLALEELDDLAPVPDLVPEVLARVHSHRRRAGLKWLIPALQGAVTLVILGVGWSHLVGYWTAIVDTLPTTAALVAWEGAMRWIIFHGSELGTWPARVWAGAWHWARQVFSVTGLDLSLSQLIVVGIFSALLWLACNAMLVRRSLLNGHKT